MPSRLDKSRWLADACSGSLSASKWSCKFARIAADIKSWFSQKSFSYSRRLSCRRVDCWVGSLWLFVGRICTFWVLAHWGLDRSRSGVAPMWAGFFHVRPEWPNSLLSCLSRRLAWVLRYCLLSCSLSVLPPPLLLLSLSFLVVPSLLACVSLLGIFSPLRLYVVFRLRPLLKPPQQLLFVSALLFLSLFVPCEKD